MLALMLSARRLVYNGNAMALSEPQTTKQRQDTLMIKMQFKEETVSLIFTYQKLKDYIESIVANHQPGVEYHYVVDLLDSSKISEREFDYIWRKPGINNAFLSNMPLSAVDTKKERQYLTAAKAEIVIDDSQPEQSSIEFTISNHVGDYYSSEPISFAEIAELNFYTPRYLMTRLATKNDDSFIDVAVPLETLSDQAEVLREIEKQNFFKASTITLEQDMTGASKIDIGKIQSLDEGNVKVVGKDVFENSVYHGEIETSLYKDDVEVIDLSLCYTFNGHVWYIKTERDGVEYRSERFDIYNVLKPHSTKRILEFVNDFAVAKNPTRVEINARSFDALIQTLYDQGNISKEMAEKLKREKQ